MEDESGQDTPKRLRAVHARRLRIPPEQRKRVGTACNNCSLRHVKCSGERPCRQCSRMSRTCEYPEDDDKVVLSRRELEALQATRITEPALSLSVHLSPHQLEAEDVTPSEGRLLHDPEGTARYFGESSGANFLNHVKEFMATILPLMNDRDSGQPGNTFLKSVGRYQTYDSRPLSLPESDPLWLPSRTEMTLMFADFRYLLQDGNQDFPSGGIFYWGDVPLIPPDPRSVADLHESGQLALLHVLFAVATQLGSGVNSDDSDGSLAYFSRARAILGNPLDITMYMSRNVSTLLLMALYLIEMNRRDAAYMTVNMAIPLAIMYGAHTSCGEDEGTKRVFWTLYIIDGWLSSLLGRPPGTIEEAIRLKPPVDIPGYPHAAGLQAHVELTRISRYIVCNVYRIAPWDSSAKTTLENVEQALKMLREWRESLPSELQLESDSPGQDRACCSLHLEYNQLIILTTRPIFFMAVKKRVADHYLWRHSKTPLQQDQLQSSAIRQCSETARQNLSLGRWIRRISPRQKFLHHEAHSIFNAAIILLLYQMAFPNRLDENNTSEIGFAIEVFEQDAQMGNNFAIDCARVLQDLSFLVQAHHEQGARQRGLQNTQDISETTEMITAEMSIDSDSMAEWRLNLSTEEYGTLYRELQGWLDKDYFQLYNDYVG